MPKYLYGLVEVKDSIYDTALNKMELTFYHAVRYKQTVSYEGVFYYNLAFREKGLYPLLRYLEFKSIM